MITLDGVSKFFHTSDGETRVILDNVTVEFPRGRNVGILGSNGAGKSTLIRLLSGAEYPDKGTITREGLVSFPLGFASVFHPDLSGRENVEFIARIYSDDIQGIVEYVENFTELGTYFNAPTHTYSSGMLSKLAFGTCLAIDFDIYLVDEITEVGDQNFRRKALSAFQARASRSDIILVSHNVHTLKQYCEVGAILFDGKLNFFEDLDSAMSTFDLLTADSM